MEIEQRSKYNKDNGSRISIREEYYKYEKGKNLSGPRSVGLKSVILVGTQSFLIYINKYRHKRVCTHACSVAQSFPNSLQPMDCSPPGSSLHGISPGKNTVVGCHFPPPWNLPNSGIEPLLPVSPCIGRQILYH